MYLVMKSEFQNRCPPTVLDEPYIWIFKYFRIFSFHKWSFDFMAISIKIHWCWIKSSVLQLMMYLYFWTANRDEAITFWNYNFWLLFNFNIRNKCYSRLVGNNLYNTVYLRIILYHYAYYMKQVVKNLWLLCIKQFMKTQSWNISCYSPFQGTVSWVFWVLDFASKSFSWSH